MSCLLWPEKNKKIKLKLDNLEQILENTQKKVLELEEQAEILKSFKIKHEMLQKSYDVIEQKLNGSLEKLDSYKADNHRLNIQYKQLEKNKVILDTALSKAEDKIESIMLTITCLC